MIGATVLVKGTQNGTVTDVVGRFHLKVNSGETLVVSYIGMKSHRTYPRRGGDFGGRVQG